MRRSSAALGAVVLAAVALGPAVGGVRIADARPAPIHVAYDTGHLDLDQHVLQFKPSRAVTEASLVAIGEDGGELGKGAARYPGDSTGWLAISWTQPADARVMMLRLLKG